LKAEASAGEAKRARALHVAAEESANRQAQKAAEVRLFSDEDGKIMLSGVESVEAERKKESRDMGRR
jgi:hypothetical protein